MKAVLFMIGFVFLTTLSMDASAQPVYSANGFICGKKESTVTCKGPIPGSNATVTGTGHNIIYLTVNNKTAGQPTRYTYFSDTGCLIGYTFNAEGKPIAAVASHRDGEKKTFEFGDGKYEKVINFCAKGLPGLDKSTS